MSPSTPVLLHLLLLVSLASAGHFYGGTMSFTPKGRNADGTFKVDFRYKNTHDWCDYEGWYCSTGNCGSSVKDVRGTIDSSSRGRSGYNNQWCETETVETKDIPSDKPFQLLQNSCCWIPTVNGLLSWSLETQVDLGTRSDTGEPNRSPVTAILPFIRVPQNCQRSYNLMAFDPDGDRVRCRYGLVRPECDRCDQPSGFYLDQDSCSLQYGYTSTSGVYGFELVVEDFPNQHITLSYTDGSTASPWPTTTNTWARWPTTASPLPTTTNTWARWPTTTTPWSSTTSTTESLYSSTAPLSKLPLHFSLLVDSIVPSCDEGMYLPRFVQPTPHNGEHLHAEVNKELEFRVKAEATHSTVNDVIVSGPLNITNHMTTQGEFVIRWTPIRDNLGEYFPICFITEGLSGSSVYQSEMRCVVVEVGRRKVKAKVVCDETKMTVEVEKSSVTGIHEDHLRLNDPSNSACDLQRFSNNTHIIGVIPLNACGTQIEEDDDNLIFKNEITTFDNPNDIITRHHQVEIQFYCQYAKRGNVSLGFTAHRDSITVVEKGFGTFTYQFEFYQTSQFTNMVDPRDYPLDVVVKQMLYMDIEAVSTVNNTELFVESCRAAPYDNPNYHPTYPIIENGCIVDETVQIFSPRHQRHFQFGMEAFKFIGMHDQVYISCSVILCEAGNPNTRCAQGCVNSTSPQPAGHHHRKREAAMQTAKHHISQGPLRLRRSSESSVTNMNMGLMVGCIVAAVAMLCGVMLYKDKTSGVKYQPLTTFET
ncbi:uncharacterized protein [Salmo salar]|uniref:ZP domain-containing protein n=1 Tax=Salmo salar TaxID=8030 RepID=A0A1S3PWJ5_SALSA|nr:uncharacterized protein LOC106587907 [Salmo salar]